MRCHKACLHLKIMKRVLLVDTVENSSEIDFVRAAAAKERAEERIAKKESADDIKLGEMALKRSLIRLSLQNK